MDIWSILGIEKTKSKEEIVAAYREQLAHNNPEENQEGFMALRDAYEKALEYIKSDEDEFDQLIARAEAIYGCFRKRIDPQAWEEILQDPLIQQIDSRMSAEARIIYFLMEHYRLSKEVFSMFAREFDWENRMEELSQHFSAGFFHYVFDVIRNGEYYKMDYFDGDDYADYDLFIEKCMDFAALVQQNHESAKGAMEELDAFEIYHPYYWESKAEYFIKQNDLRSAHEITDDFESLYPDHVRLLALRLRILMKEHRMEEGKRIADKIRSIEPENRMALLFDILQEGDRDIEKAKEDYYEFNRTYTYGDDAGEVAEILNEKLIPYLEGRSDQLTPMDKISLAWCYYEREEEERAYQFLETFRPILSEEDKEKAKNEKEKDEEEVAAKYYKLKGYLAVQTERFKQAVEDIEHWERLKEKKSREDNEELDTEAKKQNDINEKVAIYRSKSYAYGMLGQEEQAEEYIRKIIAIDERNLDAFITLSNMYLDAGKYDEIVKINTEAMQKNGEAGPLLYLTGLAEFRREHYGDALRLLDAALENMPYLTRIMHYKLIMFDGWNLVNEFENQLEDLKNASGDPLSPKLMKLYEIKLFRMKRELEKANGQIRELIDAIDEEDDAIGNDDRALIMQEASTIFRDMKRYDKALEYIDRASRYNPLNRSIELDKGYLLVLNEKYYEAENFYIALTEKYPDDAIYCIRLAATKARSSDKMGAIRCYQRALELDPERYDIYSYISDVYLDMNDYDNATKYKTLAVEHEPSYENYYDRANHYYRYRKYNEAYQDLLSAKELQPYDSDPWTFLGICAIKMGNYEEAQFHYEKALEYFDSDRYGLNPYMYLAVKYTREKRYDEVIPLLEKAFTLFGEEGGCWAKLRLAQAYYFTGNPEKAKQCYSEAIAIDPKSCEAHYDYAIFLYRTQGAEQGRKYFLSLGKNLLDDVNIRRNFGLYCYMTMLDFEEAQSHYLKALELSGEEADLFMINLFEAIWYDLRSNGKKLSDDLKPQKRFFIRKKKQYMENFFRKMTDQAEVYYDEHGFYEEEYSVHWLSLMSECYFYLGDLDNAEKFAHKALNAPTADFALIEKSMDAYYILGMIYEQRGAYEEALAMYEEIRRRSANTSFDFVLFQEALDRIKRKMNR